MVDNPSGIYQGEEDYDLLFLWEAAAASEPPIQVFIPPHDELIALVKRWHETLLDGIWLFGFLYPT